MIRISGVNRSLVDAHGLFYYKRDDVLLLQMGDEPMRRGVLWVPHADAAVAGWLHGIEAMLTRITLHSGKFLRQERHDLPTARLLAYPTIPTCLAALNGLRRLPTELLVPCDADDGVDLCYTADMREPNHLERSAHLLLTFRQEPTLTSRPLLASVLQRISPLL